MGNSDTANTNSIVRFTCSACHANTIYINVVDYENNQAPFKANHYICTECEQGLVEVQVAKKAQI